MQKKQIQMEDGRYLIYFSFDDEPAADDNVDEADEADDAKKEQEDRGV